MEWTEDRTSAMTRPAHPGAGDEGPAVSRVLERLEDEREFLRAHARNLERELWWRRREARAREARIRELEARLAAFRPGGPAAGVLGGAYRAVRRWLGLRDGLDGVTPGPSR
jgi:hypothetical protein